MVNLSNINAQTIKDISTIVGIRSNQLIGYGLVVGLNGTGDKSQFTMQSLQNLLRNSYIKLPPSAIKSKNVAAVMVTAELPAFAIQGDKIDVRVSTIGDSKSIDNGELLITQLKAVNGEVFALAQGKVLASKKAPTTGSIYRGAMVENSIKFSLRDEKSLTLALIRNDAKTADTIETIINNRFKSNIAYAQNTRSIFIKKPENISMIKFISIIENLNLDSSLEPKIIIDLYQESIIAGNDVLIKPVTLTNKDYTFSIGKIENDKDWKTAGKQIGKNIKIDVNNSAVITKDSPTVGDLVKAMKSINIDILDIINVIQKLKSMNAIEAKVEVKG